jgi:alpha-beta hydrolase superfamily lysophospholipase
MRPPHRTTELVTSAGCSGGAAETSTSPQLTEDPSRTAISTFPLLYKAVNLNLRLFAGKKDTYAKFKDAEAEVNQLKTLGSTQVELVPFDNAVHEDMSWLPWKESDYMQWAVDRAG